MVVSNTRKGAEKVMGITLVSGLALAMGAGAAPAVALVAPASSVKAAFIATPEVDLGGGVSVTGPAKPFKDDASGAYWYKEGGKFTLKVSTPSINKVSVTVNGETVIDEDLGVAGPDTFEKDFEITANSEIKINVTHGSVMGADKQSADKKLPDTKAADTVIKESVDPKTGKTTPEKVVPGEVIPGKTVKGALVAGEPTAASVMLKSMVTNFDTTAPVTSGTATEVGQDAGKSYVGANSVFTASAVDEGIGLGSLVLEKFDAATNTWVKSRDVVNGTGFKLTVSGKYRLFSTDLLGNTSAHTFADVFGVSEDVIYVAPAAGGVDYTVNGAPNTKGFYVDAAKVAVVFKGSFTTSTKITVNGVATTNKGWDFNSADRTFNIDLKNVARAGDGVYKIHAETTALGGKTTSADYVVKADFDAPTIDNATLDGQYEVSGNVIYAGAGAVVSFDVNDVGSGLKSVTVAGAAVTVSSDGSRKSFTLKSGQDYAITATDAVGHTTTRRLTQLGLPSNSVVVDPTAPVMKETAVVDPNYTTSPGDKWYVKAPVSQWTVTDDNLKSVQVDVNGQVDTLKPNSAGVYAVDLAGYPLADGNRLSVTVIASDKSGNVTKEVRTLFIDGDAPVDLQADVEGSYQDTDSGVYSRTPLRLNASANDGAGAGIQTYQLLDSTGKVVSEFADGVLNIPSGNHSIVVVDFNGNKSAPVTLQTLLGTKSNNFVYDDTAPELTEKDKVKAGYVDGKGHNWYSKAPISKWTVADANLSHVEFNINGKIELFQPNETGVYSVDLSKYALADGNRLNVAVEAYDLAGSVTKTSFELYVDGNAPVEVKGSVDGEFQDTSSGVYYQKTLTLKSSASDGEGTGVKTYQLLNAKGEVVKEFPKGSIEIPQGQHSIVVVDFLGNKSAPILLKDLLGTKSNKFVHDATAPTLVESKPTKPGYTAGNGDKWYVTAPKSSWDVKDENLKSVEITVNGKTETFKPNDAGIYSVDLKNYALQDGNKLSISVVATDLANNITRNNSVLFVDGDAPRDLQATVAGAYQDRDFGVYAQSPLVLSAKSNDGVGIGIKTYQLVDTEGKVVSEFSKGTIEIPQGQYRVVVVDLLGNKSAPQTLQSLLGLKTNIFNYDSTAPKISVDRRDANHQNWFGSDVDYTVNYSDNLALYSGTVSVNGKELGNFTSGGVETGHSLKFSTSQADANEDGSYNIVANGTDAAGNPVSWSETVKVDRDAPSIQSFTFTASGYKEGEALSKSDEYGFFFQDATSVDIKTEDLGPSSGVKEITYVLRNDNGSELKQGIVPVDGNSARVDIPVGFKGYIDASATDFVAHTGETRHPSGVITEDRNWYMNTSDIQIQLADPGNRDTKNQFLYRGDAVATVPIKQGVSGIKSVQWGIGDTTLGDTTVAIDGSMTGTGFTVDERGKNLVLGVTGNLPINGNANDMRVWVKVTDRAGYTSDADKTVSIDKDAPVIDVSYNDTNPTSYYAADRTATVTITERNFDPKDVKWTGKYGSLGNWQNVGGDVWRASIVFSEETEYAWGVSYTDLAGNAGNSYESETFTVDKTAPQLSVTFDNNSVQNGKFYKAARTAVVEVIDRNFDASKVAYAGDGALGGWSSNGDLHTATVSFGTDGAYKFNVGSTDKAGNASNSFDSGDFTVDTTKPAFAIEGVKNGVSYKKDVGFRVTTSDTYVDTKASFVTLTGRKNGKMEVEGGFNESTGNFEIKNFPNEKEFDDLYTLSAKVVDLAGNEVAEDVVFSVNRFGSDFKFQTEDLNGEYFQKLPSDIVLTQTSVDQLDMNGFSVVVLRNGEKIEVPKAAWNVKESGGGESNWVYTITVNKDFFKEDGAYQVQMFSKATDGTQESSMSQEYAFVIDNTKPVIYISGVEDKTVYKALEKDVTVEVRDLSGVAELSILLNDVEQPYTEENGVYKITIPANSKNNDIYVEAKDRAGNMERVGVVDFYLTSSEFEAMWQKSWVRWLAVTVGVLFAMVLALILRGAIKRRKEEDERQTRLDAAQAASSGHLDNTSGAIADVNMDIPVEDAYLETGIAGAAGASAAPTPSESGGVAEDDQATDFIDEGNGSTEHFDEGDGSTGYFTDGGNDNK